MSLFSALMPREGQFFTMFNDHAALVVKGGRELFELLQDYVIRLDYPRKRFWIAERERP